MPLTEKGQEIKKNMEHEYGPEKGERVFYASKNAGTIHGVDSMDAVPIASCYGKDQSWPPMDPTSIGEVPNYGGGGQPSGMREPTDADPVKAHYGPEEGLFGKSSKEWARMSVPSSHVSLEPRVNPHQKPIKPLWSEKEVGSERHLLKKDAAPQPGEPGHEARELAVAHELEAMHGDAAEHESAETRKKERERLYSEAVNQGKITGKEYQGFREAINQLHARGDAADTSFDQAMAGYFGGAPDFSGDARSALGGAPEVVTQRQMANFASNFNYGQKGSPY